jgi:predicted NBD/HSP70 family sugar kinase
MCSPAAIARDVAAELAMGATSRLAVLFHEAPEMVDHNAICEAAAAGDPVARRVIDGVAEYLGKSAVTIANALDVDLLVIGGKAITHVAGIYRDRVEEFLTTRPLARKTHTVRVAVSDMAHDGAALGAASLVLHAAYAPNAADLTSV